MKEALNLAQHCTPEQPNKIVPKVAALLVDSSGNTIRAAYRGQDNPGAHAEYLLLENDLPSHQSGLTLFTTLEPCTKRNPPKIPCAERIADKKDAIHCVFVGMCDPNPDIHREAYQILKSAGILQRDFSFDIREDLQDLNQEFLDQVSRLGLAPNQSRFNIEENNGVHQIPTQVGHFKTEWSRCSDSAVYACSSAECQVGNCYGKTSPDEIDDPEAQGFSSDSVRVEVGQLVIFRRGPFFLIVELINIDVSLKKKTVIHIEFTVRPH